VIVLIKLDVVVIVSVAGILVAVGILVVIIPAILTVRRTGLETCLVAVVQRLAKHLCTVLARVVILAATVVTLVVDQVVVVLGLLQPDLVTPNAVPISLLIGKVLKPSLLLQIPVPLLLKVLPVLPA
jgi:hypothetical protein